MISIETETTKPARKANDVTNAFDALCNNHIQPAIIKPYISQVCVTFICRLFQTENGISLICSIKVFIKRISQESILPVMVANTLINEIQSSKISPYSI